MWETWRVRRDPSRAMKLFTSSTVYLSVVFAAVVVDVLVR
jgi:heme O synthase-like polyprenyltransferase